MKARMQRAALAFVVAAPIAGVFVACLGATQIDGELSSDTTLCAPKAPAGGAELRARYTVRVRELEKNLEERQSDGELDRCNPDDSTARLGAFTLLPETSDGREHLELVEVVLDTLGNPERCYDDAQKVRSSCVVVRRRVRFVPHEGLRVPMYLDDRCLGVTCEEDQTCFRGGCKPADAPCDLGVCVPAHERALGATGVGYDPSKVVGLPPDASSDGATVPGDATADGSVDATTGNDADATTDGGGDGATGFVDCAPCPMACCSVTGAAPFFCRATCNPGERTCLNPDAGPMPAALTCGPPL